MVERILVLLGRPKRRRLERWARKSGDGAVRVRVQIVVLYSRGWGCSLISDALGVAPSTAIRVARRYLEGGEEGLVDGRTENGTPKVDDDIVGALAELLEGSPEDHGWSRPTWTRELLAQTLEDATGVCVSVSTVARMLRRLGARWKAARPFVLCPWPGRRRRRRLAAIRRLVRNLPKGEVAFYEDEVDIHLNPKIGRDWMHRGTQKTVLTPGRNKKRYVGGALSVRGDELVWVEHDTKTSDLFLLLLNRLRQTHPKAKRIHLILDNYIIHSSRKTACYLRHCGQRIRLHFLPPYCPQHNPIERVWGDLHAQVTRNHRCGSLPALMGCVRDYLDRWAA